MSPLRAPPRRVIYVHSGELIEAADALPANPGRASLVHHLIDSLDLLGAPRRDQALDQLAGQEDTISRAQVIEPIRATREMLSKFHDLKYIDALLGDANSTSSDSDTDSSEQDDETPDPSSFRLAPSISLANSSASPRKRRRLDAAQLVDDCPVFPELPDYVSLVAGASIEAARALRDDRADVAIAWTGGRHHGKRGTAAGFCYVNDIVLAIQELRLPPRPVAPPSSPTDSASPSSPISGPTQATPSKISRVLYLDLDLHHGDGVEVAFNASPYVLTLSVHLHAPLFFPATGSLDSHGPTSGAASYHALNLALEPGLSSSTLIRLFESSIDPIFRSFDPDAVVVQCGVDGLQGDPCAEWNLSCCGLGEVVKRVIEGWGKRTLLLGGGGYDKANAARCWAYLTSVALGRPLPLESTEIPSSLESDEYELYRPSFMLDVSEGHRKDLNTGEKLESVEAAFRGYASKLEDKYRARKEKKLAEKQTN